MNFKIKTKFHVNFQKPKYRVMNMVLETMSRVLIVLKYIFTSLHSSIRISKLNELYETDTRSCASNDNYKHILCGKVNNPL